MLRLGIVGLPNVGKSTLFNALTAAGADAANYPFCTVEPNVGMVEVPDSRIELLADRVRPQRTVRAVVQFVDIAGLVEGASRGEGLGNRFLGAIREVDAILQVLRCFESEDVSHVEGTVDPLRDAELVETELLLADLEGLERRREGLIKRARGGDKAAQAQLALIEAILPPMQDGRPARALPLDDDRRRGLRELNLLTAKPVLYVANVEETAASAGNPHARAVAAYAERTGAGAVVVSAAIEAELVDLRPEERAEFLASLGLAEPGLNRVIRAGYRLLDLITFFTAGPKETRAWTVPRGTTAPEAAGVIHSDFQRGFICAETIAYEDYVAHGGEQGAKEAGRMRQEGRGYVVRDGDIMLFRFNV
jgi:ribosome-binding ATPase